MIRIIDPPIAPDRDLFQALLGHPAAIRLLYDALVGKGAGRGLGWAPMLCEIVRRIKTAGQEEARP